MIHSKVAYLSFPEEDKTTSTFDPQSDGNLQDKKNTIGHRISTDTFSLPGFTGGYRSGFRAPRLTALLLVRERLDILPVMTLELTCIR